VDVPPVGFIRRRAARSDPDTVSRLFLVHGTTPEQRVLAVQNRRPRPARSRPPVATL
jgi:hypothetical protein